MSFEIPKRIETAIFKHINNIKELDKIEEDELFQRRKYKKITLEYLTNLKEIAEDLNKQKDVYSYLEYKALWLKIGSDCLLLLDNLDERKVKITEKEYQTIFNIQVEKLSSVCKGNKPKSIMDVLFVERLSNEPFIEAMVDAVNEKLPNKPKIDMNFINRLEHYLYLTE